MSERYDLIVLGAGSAARDGAARAAGDFGARVALVERERWGGSCPNVACRPTKAYLVAAEQVHDINVHAAERGVEVGQATIDMPTLRRWKDSLRRSQESWLELLSGRYDTVTGEASFVDAHTVRVDGRELTADRILIATGSRTAVPNVPGIEEIRWLDHISALEDERIEVILNSGVDAFRKESDMVIATLGGREVRVSDVLLASGRTPNTDALAPESAGVETDRGFVVVDHHQRTTAEGIWAAGDVAIGPMLTPTAQYQARVAVEDMLGTDGRTADYAVLPTAIFTDPELGAVGMSEREAQAAGHDVDVAKHELKLVTRAQYTGTKHGLYKIVFDRRTRKVLGVHVVSRGASDIVGGLAVALQLGATVDDLALMHHIYPSFSEGIKAAAEQALPKKQRTVSGAA